MDSIFLGAFWGAFFSFCFFMLGLYLPKILKRVSLKLKTKKKINRLYHLFLLERNSNTFFFNLIELFSFVGIIDFLKGHILMSGDRLQFENNSWDILIVDKIFEARLTIRTFNNLTYYLGSDNREQKIEVILDFIQYIETRCKQENIKLRINSELKKAKEDLKSQFN